MKYSTPILATIAAFAATKVNAEFKFDIEIADLLELEEIDPFVSRELEAMSFDTSFDTSLFYSAPEDDDDDDDEEDDDEEDVETVEVVRIKASMGIKGYTVATFDQVAQTAWKDSLVSLINTEGVTADVIHITEIAAGSSDRRQLAASDSIEIDYELYSTDEDANFDEAFMNTVQDKLVEAVTPDAFAAEFEDQLDEAGATLPDGFAVEEIVFEEPETATVEVVEKTDSPVAAPTEEDPTEEDPVTTSSANTNKFLSAVFIVALSATLFV